jgi:ADP-ribosylglycohydrolase
MRASDQFERAHGAILGQFSGDAFGSQGEFQNKECTRRKWPHGIRDIEGSPAHRTQAGQMTDDSEMAMELAESIVRAGRYSPLEAARGYVRWYHSHPFDVGATTSLAMDTHAAHGGDDYYNPLDQSVVGRLNHDSQANGALMRVSPLGVYGSALPLPADSLYRHVYRLGQMDSQLTHPH